MFNNAFLRFVQRPCVSNLRRAARPSPLRSRFSRSASVNKDDKGRNGKKPVARGLVDEKNKRTPLPAVNRDDPNNEFTRRDEYETILQSFWRRNILPLQKVTGEVLSMVASRETLYIVSGTGLVLFAVAASEAVLSLTPDIHTLSAEGLHFVWSYSTGQILPSFIWSTKPAALICQSIGLDPSQLLFQFHPAPYDAGIFGSSPNASAAADAQRELTISSLQCFRAVVAQSILLANVLNVVNRVVNVNQIIEQRVLDGKEPFAADAPLIRGSAFLTSGATTVSLRHFADHLIPVFESSEIGPSLARRRSDDMRNFDLRTRRSHLHFSSYLYPQHQPMYWKIPPHLYMSTWVRCKRHAWAGFNFVPDFFLRTTTGKRILYLEADATNEEDSLSLGRRARDLTIEDASQGCWGFEQFVRSLPHIQDNVSTRNFRVCRVFLGDLRQVHRTGGGLRLTAGDRLKYLKEFDVAIDSQLLVLAAILKWCALATKDQEVEEGKPKRIAFHTTNAKYFRNLELLLENFGYDLQDSVEVQHFEQARYNVMVASPIMDGTDLSSGAAVSGSSTSNGSPEAQPPLWIDTSIPHLVYHETSAESVMEIKHLLSAGLVNPELCCVLVDSFEEHQLIKDMIKHRYTAAGGLNTICSPVLYDEAFRCVREWTRMGHQSKDIQEELDAEVAHLNEALNTYALRKSVEEDKLQEEKEDIAVAAAAAAVEAARNDS